LIVQKEFDRADVVTVVALIIAINQGVFAFAPAIIGALRDATMDYRLPFAFMAVAQLLAAVIVLLGRGTGLGASSSFSDRSRSGDR
jgi:cyanate permease